MELVEIMEETWDALLLRAEEKLGNTEEGLQQYLSAMAAYEDSVSEEFLQYLYQLRNYYEKQKRGLYIQAVKDTYVVLRSLEIIP